MKLLHTTLVAAALIAAAVSAQAQPGPGGPCLAASAASGTATGCPGAMGTGMGAGMGAGMGGPMMGGGMRWGRDTTPGWSMMSTEERQAHWDKMHSFKSYDECKAYMDQHHQDMVARAKERGVAMPGTPRRDACASLKAPAKPAKAK